MSKADKKKAPPITYLLKCSDGELANFELAKLGEAQNMHSEMFAATVKHLRREMLAMFERIAELAMEEIRNQEAMFNRLVEVSAQALLATWLRTIDRQELVRQLLESSTVTLDGILDEAKAQIRDAGRGEDEAKNYGMRIYPPGVAHRNASRRYQAANVAAALCEVCGQPVCRESVRRCTKHLAKQREKNDRYRQKKGIAPGTHGRHPNTLKALKEANEKRKRDA